MKLGFLARTAAVASAAALALSACSTERGSGSGDAGETMDLTFGTGGTSGVYYPLGNEYANIFEDAVDGLTVSAVESDGSADNIGRIASGEAQLGFTQNNTFIDAVEGTGQFEDLGAEIDNVGWMGQLYPEAAQVITLEQSGFESIADLKGKRIAVGAPGSGTRAVAESILAAYDINEGDYEAFEEGFADARSLMQDGNIDASIEILGVPAASLGELSATTDVKLLPLDQDVADKIAGESNFEAYTIEGGTYDFAPDDLLTVSVFATIVGSTDQISEETGYEITKAIYERAGDISLAQGELIKAEDGLLGRAETPLHPGAEKYYQEQGLLD